MNDSLYTCKRERFSAREKALLRSLISKRQSIIEGRRSDNVSLRRKSRAWEEIQDEFNSAECVTKRSWQQLKKFWCNERHLQKKMSIEEKKARGEDVAATVPIELLFPESQRTVLLKPISQVLINQDKTEEQLDTTAHSENDFVEDYDDDIKVIEHSIEDSSDTMEIPPATESTSISPEYENSVNESSNASENISDDAVEESNTISATKEEPGTKKLLTVCDQVDTEERYLLNKCKIRIELLNKRIESAAFELKCKKEMHELYIKTEKEKHEANKKRLDQEHRSRERRLQEAYESSEKRRQSIHIAKLKLLGRNI